jgi:hypothetical protein
MKKQLLVKRMVMLGQELRFVKSKLIKQEGVVMINWCLFQESKCFSSQVSSLSRVCFKSNYFRNIDQRQEYVG